MGDVPGDPINFDVDSFGNAEISAIKSRYVTPGSVGNPLRLSCRTGCRALCASLRTVSWVMREVAGRVGGRGDLMVENG